MKTLHTLDDAHGGVAVARALALIDLVHRDSADSAAMGAILEAHGEPDVSLTRREASELADVCRRLRAILVTTTRADAAAGLNALLAEFAGPPRLVRHEGWDWHLHVDRDDDAPWAAWLAASAALDMATRLVASDDVPWGECGAGCGRVFVHDGRGGERRYCSSTCATRERVRRHRGLRRTGPAEPTRDGASATA